MGVIGSKVPGFRLQDFDTTCPTTGEICPVQHELVLDYVGGVTKESDDVCFADRAKLVTKLTEYHIASRVVSYEGAEAGTCPTRISMDASVTRKQTLTAARSMKNLFKRNRGING